MTGTVCPEMQEVLQHVFHAFQVHLTMNQIKLYVKTAQSILFPTPLNLPNVMYVRLGSKQLRLVLQLVNLARRELLAVIVVNVHQVNLELVMILMLQFAMRVCQGSFKIQQVKRHVCLAYQVNMEPNKICFYVKNVR